MNFRFYDDESNIHISVELANRTLIGIIPNEMIGDDIGRYPPSEDAIANPNKAERASWLERHESDIIDVLEAKADDRKPADRFKRIILKKVT